MQPWSSLFIAIITLSNIINAIVLTLMPWPNDQTLFAKHLRFAFQAMFGRSPTSQTLFDKHNSRNNVLKNLETFSASHKQNHLNSNVFRRSKSAKQFV